MKKNELTNKKDKINKDDFKRIKKLIYGIYAKEFNDVQDIARMFLSDFMKGINSFDYLEEIDSVDLEYIEQLLNTNFKEEKMVYSVIKEKWLSTAVICWIFEGFLDIRKFEKNAI